MNTIYDLNLKLTDIDKKTVNLSDYKGKVLLIVNVASKCGFTPQYEGLEKLYKKYKIQGFEILAFPCNQFANQEPGSNEEIKKFCTTTYNVTFKLFDKIEVNGPNTHPLYNFLKREKPGVFGTPDIKWNFTKFLIDRNGNVIERYAPQTSPESIEKDIVKLLANH
ncbi:MAG: glutathione peroxidase [Candidatus Kapaibacteriales bacterium]